MENLTEKTSAMRCTFAANLLSGGVHAGGFVPAFPDGRGNILTGNIFTPEFCDALSARIWKAGDLREGGEAKQVVGRETRAVAPLQPEAGLSLDDPRLGFHETPLEFVAKDGSRCRVNVLEIVYSLLPQLFDKKIAKCLDPIHPESGPRPWVANAWCICYWKKYEHKHMEHVDKSDATLNICIEKSTDLKGAVLKFGEESVYFTSPGRAVLHAGVDTHRTTRLVSGRRMNLVIWIQAPGSFSKFFVLPPFLQIQIFSFLGLFTLSSASLTSRACRALALDNLLWNNINERILVQPSRDRHSSQEERFNSDSYSLMSINHGDARPTFDSIVPMTLKEIDQWESWKKSPEAAAEGSVRVKFWEQILAWDSRWDIKDTLFNMRNRPIMKCAMPQIAAPGMFNVPTLRRVEPPLLLEKKCMDTLQEAGGDKTKTKTKSVTEMTKSISFNCKDHLAKLEGDCRNTTLRCRLFQRKMKRPEAQETEARVRMMQGR